MDFPVGLLARLASETAPYGIALARETPRWNALTGQIEGQFLVSLNEVLEELENAPALAAEASEARDCAQKYAETLKDNHSELAFTPEHEWNAACGFPNWSASAMESAGRAGEIAAVIQANAAELIQMRALRAGLGLGVEDARGRDTSARLLAMLSGDRCSPTGGR